MLLNTWLAAAKRHFLSPAGQRRLNPAATRRRVRTEELESRALLTALVVNATNQSLYTNAFGGLEIDNADMVGRDELVIEGISVSASSGNAINVNLSGIPLESIAIESVLVSGYSGTGLNISLANVTAGQDDLTGALRLPTLALEDLSVTSTVATRAVDVSLNNTDLRALTIDDSVLAGVRVSATNGSDIANGVITQNVINAAAGFEGIVLNVTASTADNFHLIDNTVTALNRDAIQINSSNSALRPMDGLTISGNQVGAAEGADVSFRVAGDTFVQPFVLTNNARQGEVLQTFVLDLSDIGLVFDVDPVTGKPFTPVGNSDAITGLQSAVVSNNNQTLTLTFSDFSPGESMLFGIDIDIAPAVPASIFGDDLIGADVQVNFSGNKSVAGQMTGDPNQVSASQFIVSAGVAGASNGITLNLNGAPLTNLSVEDNSVLGTPGHALFVNASNRSFITGVITGNNFSGSGRDGVRMSLSDSDFYGAMLDNTIANNGGSGVEILPTTSRSGLIQAAVSQRISGSNRLVITTTNHGLQTGEQIVVQGMVNDNPDIAYPGNGLKTITRIDNDRFSLDFVNPDAPGVVYAGGGAWYVPDEMPGAGGGSVTVDLQATARRGTVLEATNTGPIVITSPGHGLSSGERVRIQNVAGNFTANGIQKVTVIDADHFSLDGTNGVGAYDTSGGFGTWVADIVTNAVSTANGIVLTSPLHGLSSGDRVRVSGIQGLSGGNGSFTVTAINADTFRLNGSVGSGTYTTGGEWLRIEDSNPFTADRIPQQISGNVITGNGGAGFHVDVSTGTQFFGDLLNNTVSSNSQIGIHVESHSFGILGEDLADPTLPFVNRLDVPRQEQLGFSVNIGSTDASDGNRLDRNTQAGIAVEALDYGTGSFEIRNNLITSTRDDANAATPYEGDGIVVRLTDDRVPADSVALLTRSVIDQNTIGVDNQGNDGNGILFTMEQRTRIQDLVATNNFIVNNGQDGFHFERSEDADLNFVTLRNTRATNNVGDGMSFYAQNTVKNRLDFDVTDAVISNNGQYGMRVDVQADARVSLKLDNTVITGNGHTPAGNGYHPNDGVPGSTGAAGGIGVFAFQQVEVTLDVTESFVDDNIGDGLSVDAFNFFDTLRFDASFVDSSISRNSLTGIRNHGAAFGNMILTGSTLDENGEDGVRFASNIDKTDFFERRVGGMDLSVIAMNNSFSLNGQSGVQLGQGVSGVFGDGTVGNANFFDNNGEDGLKITQSAGPYLMSRASVVPGSSVVYSNRRHIQTDHNFFRNNGSDGIDIGHFAATEGGNVEHGDEVVADTNVTINDAVISNNARDGVEYLADSVLRVTPVIGGGQDVDYLNKSSLTVSNSRIVNNQGRGVDILNRKGEDSYINLINNEILSNRFEGVYVMNTASHFQLQNGPSDPLLAHLEQFDSSDDITEIFETIAGRKQRQIEFGIHPNIEIRVQSNLIESNGTQTVQSVVPIPSSNPGQDYSGNVSTDWTHNFTTVQGTLGGLVFRVGAVDSAGRTLAPETEWELGLSGIDAEVVNNSFDGNFGADLYIDSYTSQIPRHSFDNFQTGDNPTFRWNDGYRDPLARMDLVFRGNTGNSLDVTNGFAFLDNNEHEFKSRVGGVSEPGGPNHGHDNNPGGPFNNRSGVRFRNLTRTTGFFDDVGNAPSTWFPINDDGSPFPVDWAFDGWGTPTFRIESDFQTTSFQQTNPALGFSNFFSETELGIRLAEESYRWDTGRDAPGFVGITPYSLDRGDVFNVLPTESAIEADSLEENDSFIGATNIGIVSGPAYSVNSLADGGLLTLHTKADRDYYKFTAGGSGALDLHLNATDSNGDSLFFMLYELDPNQSSEEVPVIAGGNGAPLFFTAVPGASATLSTVVEAGKEYIIEVFSDEHENTFDLQERAGAFGTEGKPFHYGTARSYVLSMDAPALGSGGGSSSGGDGGGNSGGDGGGNDGGSGGSGGGAGGDTGSGGGSGQVAGAPIATFTPIPVSTVTGKRSSAVSTVQLMFNEDVTGVDIADFRLTRGGVNIPLTLGSVTAVSPSEYHISIGAYTGEAGDYTLTLVAAGSGIRDTDDSLTIPANVSVSWSVDNVVTVTGDSIDTVPGDGVAADLSGNASLRAAVMEANQSGGSSVIRLQGAVGTPRVYSLSLDGRFEDESRTGDLDITGNVTIRGGGASVTFISAGAIDRLFHVMPGATLTLQNLTIKGGEAFDGGAIFNEGTLNLLNVNVQNSEAFNQGGGIYNAGVLNARNSSINNNRAGSRGGAINNLGEVHLLNTTLSTNNAVSRGGGLFNETGSVSSMTNVTVGFNTSGSRGGGLASETGVVATIGNTIISDNNTDPTVTVTTANPIFGDMLGRVNSNGNNLLQKLDDSLDANAAGLLVSGANGDKFGRRASPLADINLQPLTNTNPDTATNGTWYHPLNLSSIAIDAGNNALFPSSNLLLETDQGGNPRLIEGNFDGVVTIDIGAKEYFLNEPVAIAEATPNPAGQDETITFSGAKSTHTNVSARSIVRWEWDFDYTGVFTIDATGVNATHSYSTPGQKNVRLRVFDNSVPQQSDEYDLTVFVQEPFKPEIIRPFSVTTDSTPTFRWQNGTGTFSLVVDNLTTGQNGVITRNGLTTSEFTPTAANFLRPGMYRATVTATNASGSATSDQYTFEVRKMDLLTPQTTTFDITPEFTWGSIPGTSRYEIWVNQNTPIYRGRIVSEQFISGTSFEPGINLGLGNYTWWVRAFDADNNAGDWSPAKTFDIVRPSITAPSAVTYDRTPTFTWTDVGAPRYELFVNQVGVKAGVIHQTSLTTNSFTPSVNLANGNYAAWVRAVAEDGETGYWSQLYVFQMDFTKAPPMISPIGIETDATPTFEWQAVDGAASYDLWVNGISPSRNQVIRVPNVAHVPGAATITYTPTTRLAAGTYRWWIRVNAEDGTKSSWSTPVDFTVPVPAMQAPSGTVTSTNTPQFIWTGVAEYVRYELWVDNLTTGTSRVINVKDLTTTTYTPAQSLENGTFRSWVRGFDADGNISQWSAPLDFQINASIGSGPVGQTPRGVIFQTRPTFSWTPVGNAARYEIVVKQMSLSNQPTVISNTNVSAAIGANGFVNFQSPITLIPGQTYRWWVRGINSNSQTGPWSQPVDFRVVSNDQQVFDSPFGPDNAELVIPVDVVIDAQLSHDDDVQSITAHPAGTVVQLSPPEVLKAVDIASEHQNQILVADVSAVEGIDSVMQNWADGDVEFESAGDLNFEVPSAVKIIDESDIASEGEVVAVPNVSEGGAETVVQAGGLWAGLIAMATRKSSRNRDRKNS